MRKSFWRDDSVAVRYKLNLPFYCRYHFCEPDVKVDVPVSYKKKTMHDAGNLEYEKWIIVVIFISCDRWCLAFKTAGSPDHYSAPHFVLRGHSG